MRGAAAPSTRAPAPAPARRRVCARNTTTPRAAGDDVVARGPTGNVTATDLRHLTDAAVASRASVGHTAPHPYAGCVLVAAGGRAVAAGHTRGCGARPAELAALDAAAGSGDALRGGTAYVNLEPAPGAGVAAALAAAGIQKCVVGVRHPLRAHRGRGAAELAAAGIDVVILPLPTPGSDDAAAVEAAASAWAAAAPPAAPPSPTLTAATAAVLAANEPALHRAGCGRPLGLLKYAMTLDGKIATSAGHSAWVSSPESRARVFAARAASNAVVVGGNTVRRDDPRLTTRAEGGHTPLRVVMSRTLDLPPAAALWRTADAPTVVATQRGARPDVVARLAAAGVEVLEFDFLTPGAVADWCAAQGHLQVLWECGGVLAAPALADGAIHKVLAFVAPKLIGGTARAPGPVGDLGFYQMTQALTLTGAAWSATGPDVLCTGYLPSPGGPLALDARLDGADTAPRWPVGVTSSGGGDAATTAPPIAPPPSTHTPPPPPIGFYKAWDAHGDLSNFSAHEVRLPAGPVRARDNGDHPRFTLPAGPWITWPSVEHYYQAQKFAGVAGAEALVRDIAAAASPEEAARAGRAAARASPHLVRPDWAHAKLVAMEAALRAKFGAHAGAAAALAATARAPLQEAAPSDFYWGVGVDGTGANHLGRLLAELRAELAAGGDVAAPLAAAVVEQGARSA